MFATMLGCTYLGAALCYVASPSSAPDAGAAMRATMSLVWFRMGGLFLMSIGLAMAVGTRPVSEGVIIWLSMAMAACSLLVIAAPLVDRFVPVSGTLAVIVAVSGFWL